MPKAKSISEIMDGLDGDDTTTLFETLGSRAKTVSKAMTGDDGVRTDSLGVADVVKEDDDWFLSPPERDRKRVAEGKSDQSHTYFHRIIRGISAQFTLGGLLDWLPEALGGEVLAQEVVELFDEIYAEDGLETAAKLVAELFFPAVRLSIERDVVRGCATVQAFTAHSDEVKQPVYLSVRGGKPAGMVVVSVHCPKYLQTLEINNSFLLNNLHEADAFVIPWFRQFLRGASVAFATQVFRELVGVPMSEKDRNELLASLGLGGGPKGKSK